jgi:hypothetical protein
MNAIFRTSLLALTVAGALSLGACKTTDDMDSSTPEPSSAPAEPMDSTTPAADPATMPPTDPQDSTTPAASPTTP